jgi:hypothetical protein
VAFVWFRVCYQSLHLHGKGGVELNRFFVLQQASRSICFGKEKINGRR